MRSTKDHSERMDEFEASVIKRQKSKRNKGAETLLIAGCILLALIIGAAAGMLGAKGSKQTPPEEKIVSVAGEEEADGSSEPEEASGQEEQPEQEAAQAGNIVPAAGANDYIDVIAEARRNGMTRRAYLTFDDGPSANVTPQILDILKENGIKATFFEMGRAIEANPDLTKRAADEGHLIANHSYTHDYNALYQTEDSFKNEVLKTESLIEQATGQSVSFKLFRFPGGSYNAGDHAAEKQIYKNTLSDIGYFYCDWNTLNGDAEGAPKNADQLYEFFMSNAESFVTQDKNVIVLMHDTDSKQGTADALKKIIDYLLGYGYTFHRLDDVTL